MMSAAFHNITSARKTKAPTTKAAKAKSSMVNTAINMMAANQSHTFTLFPRLPLELRLKIWKLAVVPRLVGFNSGKIPGVFQANTESRQETRYIFRILDWVAGIVYNPEVDIFFVDETSFSTVLNCHKYAFYKMHAMGGMGGGTLILPLTQHFQKVAITATEFNRMVVAECGHVGCCLQFYLPKFFPALTEFILILRPGPLGATAEDLYEVQSGNGHQYHQQLIDEMVEAFEVTQARGYIKGVKLSFMRLEKWEDTRRNELSGGNVLGSQE